MCVVHIQNIRNTQYIKAGFPLKLLFTRAREKTRKMLVQNKESYLTSSEHARAKKVETVSTFYGECSDKRKENVNKIKADTFIRQWRKLAELILTNREKKINLAGIYFGSSGRLLLYKPRETAEFVYITKSQFFMFYFLKLSLWLLPSRHMTLERCCLDVVLTSKR